MSLGATHLLAVMCNNGLRQAAVRLGDLRNPPSNRFEALSGKRKGQYSIRINDRWRVCFVWVPMGEIPEGTDALNVVGEPDEVEIVDYH